MRKTVLDDAQVPKIAVAPAVTSREPDDSTDEPVEVDEAVDPSEEVLLMGCAGHVMSLFDKSLPQQRIAEALPQNPVAC